MRHSYALLAFLSLTVFVRSIAQAPAARDTPEALTAAYNQAMQAKDWVSAMSSARQLVALNPAVQYVRLLADAQLDSGASTDALATYDRAIDQAAKEKPPVGQDPAIWNETLSRIWLGKGNALLKLHRSADAIAAYNRAAQFAANPSNAYFNACATLYNTGETKGAEAACRLSLQADPSRANAWFVLGSCLFADSTVDANGKFTVSEEGRQALSKYLELAPDGPHAADTKAMLEMAGK
jgi:tetratricopeptide (TPR) repeat protein